MISILTVVYMLATPGGDPEVEVQVLRWTTPKQCQQELVDRGSYGLLNETMPDGRKILEAHYDCVLMEAAFVIEDMAKAQMEKAQGL